MENKKRNILVFNVGSSSIKYSLFEDTILLESGIKEKLKSKKDYSKALKEIFLNFTNKKIDLLVHRVVHGGEINKTSLITIEVKNKIKQFSEFAQLHNPPQLTVIELCEKFQKPQYAVFDTMFFANLPEVSKIYPLPKKITEKYNIQRYGFHGLSHEYASKNLKGRTIVCHLGSGSSISAIKDNTPLDTSMGLTPLEGIMMGTRSGSIDPGIIFFLLKKKYDVKNILTNESGLKGISGYNDFRDVLKNMDSDKNSKLAYDLFIYRIIKTIGAYTSVLNGLDNLVFTATIGENVPKLREDICNNLKFIGIKLNKKKNNQNKKIISSLFSKVNVYVVKANEEKIAVEEVLKVLNET